MKNYNVNKNYENRPSKNRVELKNVSFDDAMADLNMTEDLWRRNGGLIINRSGLELVVEEGDGSETITFIIEEN